MRLSNKHKQLRYGKGLCSVPMWCNGCPAGFCDAEAYGGQTDEDRERRKLRGEFLYVPALACPAHGGPCAPDTMVVNLPLATWKGCPVDNGIGDGPVAEAEQEASDE